MLNGYEVLVTYSDGAREIVEVDAYSISEAKDAAVERAPRLDVESTRVLCTLDRQPQRCLAF